jgi:hypothetical protein
MSIYKTKIHETKEMNKVIHVVTIQNKTNISSLAEDPKQPTG